MDKRVKSLGAFFILLALTMIVLQFPVDSFAAIDYRCDPPECIKEPNGSCACTQYCAVILPTGNIRCFVCAGSGCDCTEYDSSGGMARCTAIECLVVPCGIFPQHAAITGAYRNEITTDTATKGVYPNEITTYVPGELDNQAEQGQNAKASLGKGQISVVGALNMLKENSCGSVTLTSQIKEGEMSDMERLEKLAAENPNFTIVGRGSAALIAYLQTKDDELSAARLNDVLNRPEKFEDAVVIERRGDGQTKSGVFVIDKCRLDEVILPVTPLGVPGVVIPLVVPGCIDYENSCNGSWGSSPWNAACKYHRWLGHALGCICTLWAHD